MRKVAPTLWIGNAFDARDMSAVHSAGIKAIVDLAVEERPAAPTRDIVYCRIPLADDSGNTEPVIRLAVTTVDELLTTETSTLVACSAGMSRSPVIAAAAIAISTQTSISDALKLITDTGPCDISASFLNDVGNMLQNISTSNRS